MSSPTVEIESAQAPPPPGWRAFSSPSWRFWVAESQARSADHLVIVTAEPGCLDKVLAIVTEVVGKRGTASLLAVRMVRSAAVLQRLQEMPHWVGRAVTLYLTDQREQKEMARQLDEALAGQGLSGPPCLRGRPYGGQSGMIFLAGGHTRQVSGPTDRLTALLDGALL
ncbi:MAG TPA: hypothetical protein VIL07_00110 [Symbiobacteriaceae bacterium]